MPCLLPVSCVLVSMAGTWKMHIPVSEGHWAFAHTSSSLVPAGPKLAVSKAVVEMEMGLRVAATS